MRTTPRPGQRRVVGRPRRRRHRRHRRPAAGARLRGRLGCRRDRRHGHRRRRRSGGGGLRWLVVAGLRPHRRHDRGAAAPSSPQHGVGAIPAVAVLAGLVVAAAGGAAPRPSVSRWLPWPVIEGFTLGIAIVIAAQQVPSALGVAKPSGTNAAVVAGRAVERFAGHPDAGVITLLLVAVALTALVPRLHRMLPAGLIAVVATTALADAAGWHVARIGALPSRLPAPELPALSHVSGLLSPALVVAALAALESLLSARVADGMSDRPRSDPDRELVGQGLANIASGPVRWATGHRRHCPYGGQRPQRSAYPTGSVDARRGARRVDGVRSLPGRAGPAGRAGRRPPGDGVAHGRAGTRAGRPRGLEVRRGGLPADRRGHRRVRPGDGDRGGRGHRGRRGAGEDLDHGRARARRRPVRAGG